MKVLEIIEQEDGSAVAQVDLTPNELKWLLEYAFKGILQDAILMDQAAGEEFNPETDITLTELDSMYFEDNIDEQGVIIDDDEEDLFAGEIDL